MRLVSQLLPFFPTKTTLHVSDVEIKCRLKRAGGPLLVGGVENPRVTTVVKVETGRRRLGC